MPRQDKYNISEYSFENPLDKNKGFEDRIKEKIDLLSVDYDLSNLNSNDMMILRSLAQALINLEDYELMSYNIRRNDKIDLDALDKLNKILNGLRSDISKMQDDLKITRKVRQSDKEESIIATLEELKKKAKEFYTARMAYIFCPTCNLLLATVWVKNPDKKSKITLICDRVGENGDVCGTIVNTSFKELYDNRGTNNVEIMPEAML
jgi:hypothetical protein